MKPVRLPVLAVLLALGALAGGLAPGPAPGAESAFVSGTEDLPLMAGLRELAGDVVVFDSPAGRIVEVLARGETSRDAVLDFYRTALPQLGWSSAGPGIFRREGESLRIDFPPAAQATGLTVRFTLSPGDGGKARTGN